MNRAVPLSLAALAVAGLAVSLYLTMAHWGGTPLACAGVGDCDYVNSSPYATLAGLPVSGLGAAMYLGLLATAALWLLRPYDARVPVVYWGLALAGFGYAAYLTYVEVYVLDALCVWCMTSATLLTAGLALSTIGVLRSPDSASSTGPGSKAAESRRGSPQRGAERRRSRPAAAPPQRRETA
jgi:uncharacterized membrane protein